MSDLRAQLQALVEGQVSVEDVLRLIKKAPFEDLDYAKVDLHRSVRKRAAEVIYGAGKTADQITGIIHSLRAHGEHTVLVTRLEADVAKSIGDFLGDTFIYHAVARIGIVGQIAPPNGRGTIVVVTAGTTDIPVAEEAVLTAQVLRNDVVRLYDVGVAGLHRVLDRLDTLLSARVIIAIAGMEGALASVLAGLVDCPVIGVPTSVGYGTALQGMTPLLAMLTSCASGLSVVNIDNGFGAAYQASLINHLDV